MVILLLLPGIMDSGVYRANNSSPGGLYTANPQPRLLLWILHILLCGIISRCSCAVCTSPDLFLFILPHTTHWRIGHTNQKVTWEVVPPLSSNVKKSQTNELPLNRVGCNCSLLYFWLSHLPLLLVIHACSDLWGQERLEMGAWGVDVSVSVSLNSNDERHRTGRVACALDVWRKRQIWL